MHLLWGYPRRKARALRAYPARPLSSSKNIRVLRLRPHRELDAPLVGDLIEQRLRVFPPASTTAPCDWATEIDAPLLGDFAKRGGPRAPVPYTALSYSWADDYGDANLTEELEVLAGGQLKITKNLSRALRRLRDPKTSVHLWVDAVCINQQDDQEKSLQVGMMAEIYSHAASIVAWLGDGRRESDAALTFMALRCFTREEHGTRNPKFWHKWDMPDSLSPWTWHSSPFEGLANPRSPIAQGLGMAEGLPKCPECYPVTAGSEDDLVTGGGGKQSWRAKYRDRVDCQHICNLIQSLMGRRYWSRRWILQEIGAASADTVMIQLGDEVMTQSDLQLAIQRGNLTEFVTTPLDRLTNCRKGTALVSLIHQAFPTACSDPRDIVYSLLSLARAEDRVIEPDYSVTAAAVYSRFARLLVSQGYFGCLVRNCSGLYRPQRLDANSEYVADRPTPSQELWGLPSWAPELSDSFTFLEDEDDGLHNYRPQYLEANSMYVADRHPQSQELGNLPSWAPDLRNSFMFLEDEDDGLHDWCRPSVSDCGEKLLCRLYCLGLMMSRDTDWATLSNPSGEHLLTFRTREARADHWKAGDSLCSIDTPGLDKDGTRDISGQRLLRRGSNRPFLVLRCVGESNGITLHRIVGSFEDLELSDDGEHVLHCETRDFAIV